MARVLVCASAVAFSMVAFTVGAEELCVACQQPAATYRCSVEQPSEKHRLGGSLEREICTKVLAKKGTHQKCQLVQVPPGGQCQGVERSVTMTDYQRAMSDAGEATYEVGAFEIARRNVHDTWQCMLSMFKDC